MMTMNLKNTFSIYLKVIKERAIALKELKSISYNIGDILTAVF